MKRLLPFLIAILIVDSAQAQSLWRNFFTTNRDPIVEVVAGSNATVQATTVGSNLRRFTVNSTATGGGLAQTNISYVAVTNAPWQTGSVNLTNWSGISTNLAVFLANNQVFTGSNYFTQPLTLSIATNTPAAGQVLTATSAGSAAWSSSLSDLTVDNLVVTNPPYLNLSNSTNVQTSALATNTPSDGQVLTATSANSAAWKTPSSGGTVYGTNVINTGLTVADLSTPSAGQFPVIWVSDVVTTSGAGDFVHWDGTNWRTMEGVIATADIRTFIMNCYKQGINASTPLSAVYFTKNASTALATNPSRSSSASGGAVVPALYDSGYYGTWFQYGSGTSSAGGVSCYAFKQKAIASGEFNSVNEALSMSNLSDSSNAYWVCFGLTSASSTNYPTIGAFFLYDMYNTNGVVSNANFSATWTNNWIAVTASSGYTYSDTGLAVSAGVSSEPTNRLAIIITSTNCVFYTNGVAAATNTSTLPSTVQALFAPSIKFVRVHGTTARSVFEGMVSAHFRRAAPVVLP